MLKIQFLNSIKQINADDWNHIVGLDFPFTRHEFLLALEVSTAVSEEMGWQPQHIVVYNNNDLIAVMPAYLKSHSYGEYVFDFEWANAYQRHGLHYYPKLVTAIPYTPATGPRLCCLPGENESAVCDAILVAVKQLASEKGLSSWHILFPEKSLSQTLASLNLPQRQAVHFQWHNNNYQSFDDFLARFSSRKRKNLSKERQKIANQGIELEVVSGADISDVMWQSFFTFYQMTYVKRSGHGGYLNKTFFTLIGQTLADKIVLVMAKVAGEYVAGALNFKSSDTLYGRYWGATDAYDSLHFEACYYQGIEYCIQNQLQRFDPGVQGEHKIKRGFEPTYTYSNHWLADKPFAQAVEHFLIEEKVHIQNYKAETKKQLPFKSGS